MFKGIVDWDNAHENTEAIQVTCNGKLVETTKDGCVLRVHTLLSMFADKVIERPKLAPTVAAPGFAPAAVQKPQTVKLKSYEFGQLLASLKAEAQGNSGTRSKLTSMEIHERLLAMKEH